MAHLSVFLAIGGRSDDPTLSHLAPLGWQRSQRLEEDPQFRALVVLVIATLLTGTVFYSLHEGRSVVDSFYFCVTTLTTVGFGDLTPTTVLSKLFTVVYILTGISIILGFIDVVARETRRRRIVGDGDGEDR